MNKILIICITSLSIWACNQPQNSTDNKATQEFISTQVNGKWTTDFTTAEELKGMHNTIENFTLLNKKKFENLKAYQEFGDLMQMHADRVTEYCQLDANTKNLLCKKLAAIKTEVQTLHGDDMVQSKAAVANINLILSEIDATFSYNN